MDGEQVAVQSTRAVASAHSPSVDTRCRITESVHHQTHPRKELDMAEAKTKPTTESLDAYLARVGDSQRRADCAVVAEMMAHITGRPAVIWGTGIVGFGKYLMTYANGKTADWPVAAFAARAGDLTIYGMPSEATLPVLPAKLGKATRKGGCLHIKRLSDVHMPTLTSLVKQSVAAKKKERVE